MKKNRLALIIGALVVLLIAAGVITYAVQKSNAASDMSNMPGMNMSSSPSSSSAHNSADVIFAQMMIPHHGQAIQMSNTLVGKSGVDSRVSTLATDIKNAQQPEIDTMNGWLKSWGEKTIDPNAPMSGMSSGMMSDSDMMALGSASGTAAAKLFLEQMVQHHQGAIAMAKTEVASGKYGPAVALAKSIVSSQSAQITTMQQLDSKL
jgi:uncharacterized protein (DUF305 family)